MQDHTVFVRFSGGVYQVLYLLGNTPIHGKAYNVAALDSMLYSIMDWTEDGKHYADEYSVLPPASLSLAAR